MHYTQMLVDKYWLFYRAEKKSGGKYSSQGCVKPIDLACQILIEEYLLSDEETKDTISARLVGLMSQIHRGTAEGVWVTSGQEEVALIEEFSRFFVDELFRKALGGDRARLSGNKHRSLINTCEFIYRRKMDLENAA